MDWIPKLHTIVTVGFYVPYSTCFPYKERVIGDSFEETTEFP